MQELQPQLAELLRTCVHPPSLLLEIVHIDFLAVKNDESSSLGDAENDASGPTRDAHRYAIKYILSDGEIMMQALLHRRLSGLRDAADVLVGDMLDIRTFSVKKSARQEGGGHIVYLAIEDCLFLQKARPSGDVLSAGREVVRYGKRKRNSSLDLGSEHLHGEVTGPTLDEDFTLHQISPELSPLRKKRNVTSLKEGISPLKTKGPGRKLPSTFSAAMLKKSRPNTQTSAIADDSKRRSRNDVLKTTFGARQILSDDDSEDEFFEAVPAEKSTIKSRRRVLRRLDGNTSFGSQSSLQEKLDLDINDLLTHPSPSKQPPTTNTIHHATIIPDSLAPPFPPPVAPAQRKSVRDGTFALSQTPTFHKPQKSISVNPQPLRQAQTQPIPQLVAQPALLPAPPFHILSSLRTSTDLPPKSYTLTTLAVVSWVGTALIHRPGSLFPPKRHLKIVDPSLASSRPTSRQIQGAPSATESSTSGFKGQNSFQDAVTVAVYIDAANFKPAAGTLVLLRGLVMQRLVNGDIILNAYGRLKEQRFKETIDKADDKQEKEDLVQSDEAQNDAEVANNAHWFLTDHAKIRRLGHGSRLDYYLDWWAEKQRQSLQPPTT